MVWFDIDITTNGRTHKAKWKVLSEEEKEYPYCDDKGNVLTKISGSFTKGYFLNEQTQERHDKAFRLINGKANEGFKGRIKEIPEEKIKYIPIDETDDLIPSKTGIMLCDELYKELTDGNKAIKTGTFVGNGYKAYKTLIYPSKLYKDVLIVKMGNAQLSEKITQEVSELKELNRLREKLKEIDITIQRVDKAKIEDLIDI